MLGFLSPRVPRRPPRQRRPNPGHSTPPRPESRSCSIPRRVCPHRPGVGPARTCLVCARPPPIQEQRCRLPPYERRPPPNGPVASNRPETQSVAVGLSPAGVPTAPPGFCRAPGRVARVASAPRPICRIVSALVFGGGGGRAGSRQHPDKFEFASRSPPSTTRPAACPIPLIEPKIRPVANGSAWPPHAPRAMGAAPNVETRLCRLASGKLVASPRPAAPPLGCWLMLTPSAYAAIPAGAAWAVLVSDAGQISSSSAAFCYGRSECDVPATGTPGRPIRLPRGAPSAPPPPPFPRRNFFLPRYLISLFRLALCRLHRGGGGAG